MDAYLQLTVFPDVKPGLEALKRDRGYDWLSSRTANRRCSMLAPPMAPIAARPL